MKKLVYIVLCAAAALALSSCQTETTAGKTWITYYPDIQLKEGETIFWAKGEAWVEPGFEATIDGEDVGSQVVIKGAPDVNTVGSYEISYSLTNADGFSSGAVRTVYVYDAACTLDISGEYTVDADASIGSDGKTSYAGYAASRKEKQPDYAPFVTTDITVTIEQMAPGIYWCNDLMAGWYTYIQGRGGYYVSAYGSDAYQTYFDMEGIIFCDNAGKITLDSSYIGAWGDGLDYIKNAKYDKGTISYDWSYAGQVFGSPVMKK